MNDFYERKYNEQKLIQRDIEIDNIFQNIPQRVQYELKAYGLLPMNSSVQWIRLPRMNI